MSEKRLKQRGYDQAMLLAMAAALALDDVAVETLKKRKDTPAQSSLDGADQRRTNVIDAYEIVDPELVAGQRNSADRRYHYHRRNPGGGKPNAEACRCRFGCCCCGGKDPK